MKQEGDQVNAANAEGHASIARINKDNPSRSGPTERSPISPANGDTKIGYGRPPRYTQFKPGHSGNPKGRPKGRPKGTLHDQEIEFYGELVSIETDGKTPKVTRFRKMLMELSEQALAGNARALQFMIANAKAHDRLNIKTAALERENQVALPENEEGNAEPDDVCAQQTWVRTLDWLKAHREQGNITEEFYLYSLRYWRDFVPDSFGLAPKPDPNVGLEEEIEQLKTFMRKSPKELIDLYLQRFGSGWQKNR